jgi:membrane protease YdiL (CAAX protease family)
MHGEFLIPIVMFAGGFAMIFGIVYLKTRQNLAMIEKGMNPKEFANRPVPFRNLKWGLLLIGAGIGLLLAFLIDTLAIPREVEPVAIYFALIAIGGGLGLVASYRIEKKELLDKNIQ